VLLGNVSEYGWDWSAGSFIDLSVGDVVGKLRCVVDVAVDYVCGAGSGVALVSMVTCSDCDGVIMI